ncbi:MAG: CHAT domain-containing protein [Bacteroidales bacterium]|nr:CHAT domain-containing protein [Bacteroidales bacterium]
MNSFKLQGNSLVFNFSVLLLACTSLSLSGVAAQQAVDTCYINILYDSSRIFYVSGDYSSAIRDLSKILTLKGKMSSDYKPEYFKVYNRLGLVYRRRGDLSEAIDFYKKALESTSDTFNLSVINYNIANIYSLRGDYSKAIYYNENSISVLEKSNDEKKYRYITDIYHNLGYSYYKLGDYNRARSNYLKSIQVSKENQLGENGDTYYSCGQAYQKLDSLGKADYCFRKAISCYTKEFGKDHYMTGMAYMNYAFFYSETGEYAKSVQLYKRAYEILASTLGSKHPYMSLCLKLNGNLYYQIGDYKQALRYYQQSLASKIYSFNDNSVYVNPNSDVLPDMDILDILKYKAQAFIKLSEHESKEENLIAALSTLELSTAFTERLRTGYLYEGSKLQLAANEHEIYLLGVSVAHSLYEISGDSKYLGMAFRYAEYSKYAVLRELKNDEMAKGVAGVPDSISNSERRIELQISEIRMQIEEESKLEHPNRSKIDGWNGQLFSLSQNLEGLMQRLESNYPLYYRQKHSNQVVNIAQLQGAMGEKEAILEYVLGDSTLYTFTITRDTFLLVKQEADSTFRSRLNFLIYALHSEYSTGYYKYRDAAYTLYRKLISPVEPLLKNKNLLIIPDGKLNRIAFDVLIDRPYRDGDKRDYRKESYLLRKYPIGYAYSATLYNNTLGSTRKGSPDFLGIAPDYKNSKDSLRNIPIGLQNVRKIALLTFGKSLTGGSATEGAFKKYCSRYGIIHFYAHGLEDTLNPTNSKLFLSPQADSADDGYLHAWEVYNMQLNAELVVLGSCYSGSGRLSEGEGVLSISRSFMCAGSQSVIMSLWVASDRSTNGMLNDFYLNLLKGMRKDEALRLAKLKYLEETESIFSHPRFWAGIVVNGNQNQLYHHWYLKRAILATAIILGLLFAFRKRKTITRKLRKVGRTEINKTTQTQRTFQ